MEPARLAAIPCPYCQIRPVAATAKLRWVIGFIIVYQIWSRTVIGCTRCVRIELLKQAGSSAIFGWWSIAITLNPIFILYNLLYAILLYPREEAVLKALKKFGYEPGAYPDIFQIGYSLAATMAAADGKIDSREIEVAGRLGEQLFEGFDPIQFRKTCKAHRDLPTSLDLSLIVRDSLTIDQKQALFRYLLAIARADGTVSEEEKAELAAIASGLDLDFAPL